MQFLYYLKSRGINLHLLTCGFFSMRKLLWSLVCYLCCFCEFIIASIIPLLSLLWHKGFSQTWNLFIHSTKSSSPSYLNIGYLLNNPCLLLALLHYYRLVVLHMHDTYHTKYPYLHGTVRIVNKFTLFQNTAWVLWLKNFVAYFL